jgi:sarcosine oxidase subunit alpha
VAAALTRNGVRVFGRSSKLHRPRGLRCGNGTCSCCAMRVDGLPNVRTCVTPLRQGMVVEREHAWPSADVDLLRAAELGAPLLHAGFYYSLFRRSPRLWQASERLLRGAAGQGEPPAPEAARRLAAARLLVREGIGVLVVGGGLAGMSAALAAADGGAEVVLAERHPRLGGAAAPAGPAERIATDLGARTAAHTGIEVLQPAEVFGWYDEGVVAVACADDLLLLEPDVVVLAAGAHDRLLPFRGWDLPGVMTAGAVRRSLRGGVSPGRVATVVTDRPEGYALADELTAGGLTVAAVADRRAAGCAADPRHGAPPSPCVPVHAGLCDMTAHGRAAVSAVSFVFEERPGGVRRTIRVTCDLVCMAVGESPAVELARQGLADGRFTLGGADVEEASVPPPAVRGPRLLPAGAANARGSAAEAAADGETAGRAAAAIAMVRS